MPRRSASLELRRWECEAAEMGVLTGVDSTEDSRPLRGGGVLWCREASMGDGVVWEFGKDFINRDTDWQSSEAARAPLALSLLLGMM